jgi:predicted nucleic acid-binding Zn ribbon protein
VLLRIRRLLGCGAVSLGDGLLRLIIIIIFKKGFYLQDSRKSRKIPLGLSESEDKGTRKT